MNNLIREKKQGTLTGCVEKKLMYVFSFVMYLLGMPKVAIYDFLIVPSMIQLILVSFCKIMGKVSPQEVKRAAIVALLRAQVPKTKIAEQENISTVAVWKIQKRLEAGDYDDDDFSRKKRTNPPNPKLTPEALEDIKKSFEADCTVSIRNMAKIKGMSEGTIRNAMKKLDLQSRVRPPRQLLTGVQKERRVERGSRLVNWLKRGGNRKKVKIFTDEKNFNVDQAYNRRNDRCVVPKGTEAIPVMRTKHPQSVMMFGLVASDGKKMPPYFFEEGLRMGQKEYYKLLRYHVVPWLKANYPNGNYVFQQDGAPAHNSEKCQNFCKTQMADFWDKSMWPPSSPDLNPLDYSV